MAIECFRAREGNTTRLAVTWPPSRGQIGRTWRICNEKRNLLAEVPCGHLACRECLDKAMAGTRTCAFCKEPMNAIQVIFKPLMLT